MRKADLQQLRELRRQLTLESFSGRDNIVSSKAPDRVARPQTGFTSGDQTVQEFTRIWRETWILPVLDELIEKYS